MVGLGREREGVGLVLVYGEGLTGVPGWFPWEDGLFVCLEELEGWFGEYGG